MLTNGGNYNHGWVIFWLKGDLNATYNAQGRLV
jgi:membrane-bound inhibitor of C-type lysozyme